MFDTINWDELAARLITLRHCRPPVKESIATDSKSSLQKVNVHLRSPSSTVDDCHRPQLAAIGHEIMQRSQAGDDTILLVSSEITYRLYMSHIHGDEIADNLANEAADEYCMGRPFDYDLSNDHTQPFKDKSWLQQIIEVKTA